MRNRLWLPAFMALFVITAPAAAQEGLKLTSAIETALASHPSMLQAQSALQSTILSLRLTEIEQSHLTLSLHATPVTGSVSLVPWEDGTFEDVIDTFDADASSTISAQVDMPWGMTISGSYTAIFDLEDPDLPNLSQSLSISQDLLPAGRLSPAAVTLAGRRADVTVARLRLRNTQKTVAQQVLETFLELTERAASLAVAEERLIIAERALANMQSLTAEQAADQIMLLDAKITATERRNAVRDGHASLALETSEFFSDLNIPEIELIAPSIDANMLRKVSGHLLETSRETTYPDSPLQMLESRTRLETTMLQLAQTRRAALPSLSLGIEYKKGSGPPGLGGLSVSLIGSHTLYDGGQRAAAIQQAQLQADSAQRAFISAQITTEKEFNRSRLELEQALSNEALAVLRWEKAHLQADQASRRHAAGAISETDLADAALRLMDADNTLLAAVHALGASLLSLSFDLSINFKEVLTAIME